MKWEYCVETVNTEYELKEHRDSDEKVFPRDINEKIRPQQVIQRLLRSMGEQGWELAACVPAMPRESNLWDQLANPWVHHFIFKRPVDEREA